MNGTPQFALKLGQARIWYRSGVPSRVGCPERATHYGREGAALLRRSGAPWTVVPAAESEAPR